MQCVTQVPVRCVSCTFVLLQVEPIVEDVRARGDAAVREYTQRFDRVDLDDVCLPIEVRSCCRGCLIDPLQL